MTALLLLRTGQFVTFHKLCCRYTSCHVYQKLDFVRVQLLRFQIDSGVMTVESGKRNVAVLVEGAEKPCWNVILNVSSKTNILDY